MLKNINCIFYATVLLASIFLFSCSSEQVGPSDDKVRLDSSELLNAITGGMLNISNFEITKREVLSEDRVVFHITAKFQKDDSMIEEYQAQENHKAALYGSYPNLKPIAYAEKMDGQTDYDKLMYRLNTNGVWELSL